MCFVFGVLCKLLSPAFLLNINKSLFSLYFLNFFELYIKRLLLERSS